MRLSLGTISLPAFGHDVEARNLAPQPLGHQVELDTVLLAQVEGVELVERAQDLLRRRSRCALSRMVTGILRRRSTRKYT